MMNIKETTKILMVISTMFPNFKMEKPQDTVNVWNWALEEYSYEQVNNAIKAYMKNSDGAFAPSIPQIIHIIEEPNKIAFEQSYTEEGEAWALVRKALSNSAYHSLEEFEKLPTLVQKALGSSSILKTMALDADFNEAVESSNFKRQYRNLVEKDKEYQRLPEEQKILIQQRSEGVGRYLEAL